jgi:predicted ribosomally synthesized peptide with nif11-like leader
MSVDQAKAFVEKMKSDDAFRARVLAEDDMDARMALVRAEGFDCGAEEIVALQELGEAELSGVAGGGLGGNQDPSGCSEFEEECWPIYL